MRVRMCDRKVSLNCKCGSVLRECMECKTLACIHLLLSVANQNGAWNWICREHHAEYGLNEYGEPVNAAS
jgi:hypothetical protein